MESRGFAAAAAVVGQARRQAVFRGVPTLEQTKIS
jgi:hypothetical protein